MLIDPDKYWYIPAKYLNNCVLILQVYLLSTHYNSFSGYCHPPEPTANPVPHWISGCYYGNTHNMHESNRFRTGFRAVTMEILTAYMKAIGSALDSALLLWKYLQHA
jgi:hypothetical protein